MYADSRLLPIGDNDQYVAPDGTQYATTYPKASIPGLTAVTLTAAPTDPTVFAWFTIDNTYTQVWHTRAFTAPELAALAALRDQATAATLAASANSRLINKAQKQTAAGNTAGALKNLLKLQQGV